MLIKFIIAPTIVVEFPFHSIFSLYALKFWLYPANVGLVHIVVYKREKEINSEIQYRGQLDGDNWLEWRHKSKGSRRPITPESVPS